MRLFRYVAVCAWLAAALLASSGAFARDIVSFKGYPPGTIVVATGMRQLFYILPGEKAVRYPVGVGRAGMAWHGRAYVELKRLRPAWQAPPEISDRGYGPVIPGGSPRNPMGAAVLGLDRGNYAIHGTNNPASVGGFVSHGCIRMYNEDILDLYARARIGTEVVVLR